MSHLLDKANWDQLAEALNNALLGTPHFINIAETDGLFKESPMERIYQQAEIVHKELLNSNVGAAAFINISRDCFIDFQI
jgi:hypothetical protein